MGKIMLTKLKLGNRVTDPKLRREPAIRGVVNGEPGHGSD